MNVSTSWGSWVLRRPVMAALGARMVSRLVRAPWLWWSLVVAAGLLAYFVHLLNAQVLRGQMLRDEQRAAVVRPAQRAAETSGTHPNNLLFVVRQPMPRP